MFLIYRSCLLFGLFLALASCATIASPEGGPKDTTPPRIDTAQSSPNEQVNFVKQPIEIAFQEWIVLEDAANQLLVSPPLEFRPDVRLKRRSVLFSFDEREQLRPNVTYTLNFGNAVKDLTEKNPAENLRFVFATGPQLDSLTLRGTLRDALSGEPIEKALFMLYDKLADSVVRKERPLYFGKTDKEGKFTIKNIREGAFKAFALMDVNANYRYDLPNEKIGFPDSLVALRAGDPQELDIPLFTETPGIRTTGLDSTYRGLLKVSLNQPPARVSVRSLDTLSRIYTAPEKDTLFIWYGTPSIPSELVLQLDSLDFDTLRPPGGPAQNAALPPGGLYLPRPEFGTLRQSPVQDLSLLFRAPIASLRPEQIVLSQDSVETALAPQVFLDSSDARRLYVRHTWAEDKRYTLRIAPDALTDLFGRPLDSALVFSVRTDLLKNYGNLSLQITGLDPQYPYLLELLLADGSPALARTLPAGLAEAKLAFPHLKPETFTLRLVEDRNGNGVLDSGDYNTLRQPERVILRKLESLRPNWDLEAEVKIE